MLTKDQIINNLHEYSASEIVHAIKCGEVSMYELSKSGNLTPLIKKRIEEQMAFESMEVNASASEEDCIEENVEASLPSIAENVEDQEAAIDLSQPEISSSPNVQIPISSKKLEPEYGILDNKGMFKRVFSFKGRIRRAEFGLSYIIFFIWYMILDSVIETDCMNPVLAIFIILTMIPAYWFLFAQGAKRCHDRGNSGWYQIIPFYGLIMLFGDGEEGINNYGTNPKNN